jgi:hypothetical protein
MIGIPPEREDSWKKTLSPDRKKFHNGYGAADQENPGMIFPHRDESIGGRGRWTGSNSTIANSTKEGFKPRGRNPPDRGIP